MKKALHLLIASLLLLGCTSEEQAGGSYTFDSAGLTPLANLHLPVDYLYGSFDANDRFLVWGELYENEVFIYDLKEKSLVHQIAIPRGQGPGEMERLFNLTIDPDNNVFLLGANQPRVLHFNASKPEEIKDIRLPKIPARLTAAENELLAFNMHDPDILLLRFATDGSAYSVPARDTIDMQRDFQNVMLAAGDIAYHGEYMIFSTQYLPLHFIHNLKEDTFVGRIAYEDVTDVRDHNTVTGQDGAVLSLPPDSVDVLFHSATGVPGQSTRLYKILEGRGDRHGIYRRDRLYVYDWEDNDFVGRLDLPVAATEVTSNSTAAFIYSDEDFSVYRYVPEE